MAFVQRRLIYARCYAPGFRLYFWRGAHGLAQAISPKCNLPFFHCQAQMPVITVGRASAFVYGLGLATHYPILLLGTPGLGLLDSAQILPNSRFGSPAKRVGRKGYSGVDKQAGGKIKKFS